MIEKHEVSALMRPVSLVIKEYVSRSVSELSQRIDSLEKRIAELPAEPIVAPPAEPIKDANREMLDAFEYIIRGLDENAA